MGRFESQVTEVINRNTFVSLALDEGFNVFLPVYDGGIDFLLHREKGSKGAAEDALRKVQLKGRWTIDQKYVGRKIWMAFPIGDEWYLMPHEAMFAFAEADGVTKTDSWTKHGQYNRPKPSKAVIEQCAPYRFRSIKDVTTQAAREEQGE